VRALAALSHRSQVSIFTALAAVDADYVRAHVREKHGAVRTGNEASEINNANSR
jgi:hypothetical protein